MKTLFLDFDGVLHAMSEYLDRPFNRVALLEPLLEISPFQVVVSSSWRLHWPLDQISRRLGRLGACVVGATGDPISGRHSRYREILSYVQLHGASDWRALDDAHLEFPEGEPRLILCSPRVGLERKQVQELGAWLSS